MGVQVIKTFVGEAGKTHEFEVEVPEGAGWSAVVFVQAQVAAKDTSDFSLAVGGAGWSWEARGAETVEGNNRRGRAGVWASATTPAGKGRVEIVCGRAVNSVMAFLVLVDEPRPVVERRALSVVVRELAAGETHEVRYVRPGELVMKEGGIDWERTRYMAHGFVIEG